MAFYYEIKVRLLSEEELPNDIGLQDIARSMHSGADVGDWTIEASRTLNGREAHAMEKELGASGMFLDADRWVYDLTEGDEVTVYKGEPEDNVPTVIIQTIEWLDDQTFRLTTKDGETIEGLASELS